MVKAFFIYSFLLVLTVSCSSGNRPFFWKAEKEGKTSYFLGTYHWGISLDELLCSEVILSKLKSSDLVLTELGPPLDTVEQEQWNETLYFAPDERDFKQLSLESQKFLEQKGVNKNLSFNALSFVLLRLCLIEAVGEKKAKVSMDRQVEDIAVQFDIPLQALDNLELRKLTLNLDTKEDIEGQIDTFHQCSESIIGDFYKKGLPTQGLGSWINNHYSRTERSKWSLKNRNEKWFTQFKSAHKKHNQIFVAAGTNHFTDAFNLIDMLKREGFDTERVSCSE